ncbi:MAG: OmpA family protein [Sulfitobacter sp.]
MTSMKLPIIAAMSGLLVLSACGEPGSGQILASSNDPNQKTKNGALIGAASGAVIGALSKGDGNRDSGAIKGAIIGGALGAGIGYSLDKQEAALRNSLGSNVGVTNTGERLIVTLPQDLLFATDSTAVRSDLQRDLAAVASNLNQYPNSTVQVVGHTDSDGEAAYNQQLSEGRARSVSNILIANGVSGARIQSFGRGEDQPIASNLSPAGKAQNRRVEIVILPNAS